VRRCELDFYIDMREIAMQYFELASLLDSKWLPSACSRLDKDIYIYILLCTIPSALNPDYLFAAVYQKSIDKMCKMQGPIYLILNKIVVQIHPKRNNACIQNYRT
jgi:hypothetical protein